MTPNRLGILVAAAMAATALMAAGCADPTTPQDASAQLPTHSARDLSDPEGTAAGRTVSIVRGTVTDSEIYPIANATVSVPALDVDLRTSSAGKFEIRGLPVGTHEIVADRSGYYQVSKQVTVKEDSEIDLDFVLDQIPPIDSFLESYNHVIYHDLSNFYISFYPTSFLGIDPGCPTCTWSQALPEAPVNLLMEVFGQYAIQNPTPMGPAKDKMYVRDNATGDVLAEDWQAPPFRLLVTSDLIGATTDFEYYVGCDFYWICFQERRDVWVTYSFGMRIPETYSAAPQEG